MSHDDVADHDHRADSTRASLIRSALHTAAAGLELDTVDATDVRRRATRRRRRRTGALAGGTAVLAVGIVGAIVTSNEPAELATTPPTSSATTAPNSTPTTVPAETVPSTAPITAPATLPPIITTPPVVAAAVAIDAPGDVTQVLPWRDGFLAIGQIVEPQPLGALSDDLVALFPEEILAVFPDGLPATIDEATAALDAAGRLDEVVDIIGANPELQQAIYATPTAPRFAARFTTDGSDWTEVPLDVPIDGYPQFSISDDRLVVSAMEFPSGPDDIESSRTFAVAITDDLATWRTATFDLEAPADPNPAVRAEVFVNSVVVIDDWWVASVDRHRSVDYEALLPDDLADRLELGQGWGVGPSDDGVVVEFFDDDGERTVVTVTWDELGLPGNPEAGVDQQPQTSLLVGDFSGQVDEVAAPSTSWFGNITSLDDRALLLAEVGQAFSSTDGRTWDPVPGLDPDHSYHAAVAVDGGHLLVGQARNGTVGVIIRADGTTEAVDLPELPGPYSLWNNGTSAAWIVELHDDQGFVPVTVVVEHEGYRLSITDGNGSTTWTLVDATTGEPVLASGPDATPDELWEFDEETATATIVITDPATGAEVVRIPDGVFGPAFDAAHEEAYGRSEDVVDVAYEPDLWLLATTDGVDWLVRDLDDPSPESSFWPHGAAVSGGSVLYQTTDGWMLEPIG